MTTATSSPPHTAASSVSRPRGGSLRGQALDGSSMGFDDDLMDLERNASGVSGRQQLYSDRIAAAGRRPQGRQRSRAGR